MIDIYYGADQVQWNLWKKATFDIDFSGWCGKMAVL